MNLLKSVKLITTGTLSCNIFPAKIMKKFLVIGIIAVSVFHSTEIFCQHNFSTFVPSAHSVGFGGSSVAFPVDPSASYWNPAGIAFITSDRILFNVNEQSQFNFTGFTKFLPPSFAIGLNLCRFGNHNSDYNLGSMAFGYRINQAFSVGTNLNFGKTYENKVFSSFGFGIFIRSFPDLNTGQTSENSVWNWFTSENMKNKLSFGLTVHNLPIQNKMNDYIIRVATAFKPIPQSPVFHFAYHASQDEYSTHAGIQIDISKPVKLFSGTKNLDINQLAFGGSLSLGHFQTDIGYELKEQKFNFSLLIKLNDDNYALAQKYKNIGSQKVKNKEFKAALNAYSKSLAYQPDDERINYISEVLKQRVEGEQSKIDSLYASGLSFEKKRWFINAFIAYQQILEIDANNKHALGRLKSLKEKLGKYLDQLFEKGLSYYSENNYNRAEMIFDKIVLVDRKHNGALTYLAKIDSIHSHTSNEYYLRGLGYYNQKNLKRGREEFEKALIINSSHAEAQRFIEKIDNEIEENRETIKKLLRDAYYYNNNNQYIKAHNCYRKILEIDNSHDFAREKMDYLSNYIAAVITSKYQKAKRAYDRNDYNNAIALFSEILAINPDHEPSKNLLQKSREKLNSLINQHYQRAFAFSQQKEWDRALEECNITLALAPKNSEAIELQRSVLANIRVENLEKRAMEYFQKNDFLNARATFQQVVDREPENINARELLKRCNDELNSKIEELFNIGMISYAEGEYDSAIATWTSILNIDPDHKSAREYIQKARERLDALNRIK